MSQNVKGLSQNATCVAQRREHALKLNGSMATQSLSDLSAKEKGGAHLFLGERFWASHQRRLLLAEQEAGDGRLVPP